MEYSFKELMQRSGYVKGYNFLILFSIFSALMIYISLYSFKLTKPLYLILYNKIKDGYFLVLLSPIVFTTWILASILLIILNIPSMCLIGFCAAAQLYGVIFEMPSDYINKNRSERDERDWSDVWFPYITMIIWSIIILSTVCTLVQVPTN